jgi:hypothetical protein
MIPTTDIVLGVVTFVGVVILPTLGVMIGDAVLRERRRIEASDPDRVDT